MVCVPHGLLIPLHQFVNLGLCQIGAHVAHAVPQFLVSHRVNEEVGDRIATRWCSSFYARWRMQTIEHEHH